jgi:predicted amidohydrolase
LTVPVRAALESDPDWRGAITRARSQGAELVCLPHLSFTPYVAGSRDRHGLELAERRPARSLSVAAELADGAWLAGSAYESEGEGVFYVTAYAGRAGAMVASSRQRCVEARPGRFEQMFWSPGHTRPVAVDLPCGPAAHLVGADVREPKAWAAVAALGVKCVLGGTSEEREAWERTTRVASGMAATYGLTVLVTNRADAGFAGGGVAFAADGAPLRSREDGLFDI